jgi:hypothetical protein
MRFFFCWCPYTALAPLLWLSLLLLLVFLLLQAVMSSSLLLFVVVAAVAAVPLVSDGLIVADLRAISGVPAW